MLEALYAYLEISERSVPPEELVAKAMGRPTKTWSGRRTERGIYWNAEVEARFRELGGLSSTSGWATIVPVLDERRDAAGYSGIRRIASQIGRYEIRWIPRSRIWYRNAGWRKASKSAARPRQSLVMLRISNVSIAG